MTPLQQDAFNVARNESGRRNSTLWLYPEARRLMVHLAQMMLDAGDRGNALWVWDNFKDDPDTVVSSMRQELGDRLGVVIY